MCGSPGTRTLNLRIKSPLLCQIELATRAEVYRTETRCSPNVKMTVRLQHVWKRATDRIRTGDILDHNQVL